MNHERDYSEIRATVADVALFNFPHARVDLMITSSTNPQILDLSKRPQTLTADNYFWTSLGKMDCGDTRNIGSVAAYYLLPGDEIRAKLFAGSSLRDQRYVYGIARVKASLTPGGPAVKEFDGLEVMLELEREIYNVGDPIPLTLMVTNRSDRPKTLNFPTGQRYDFVVGPAMILIEKTETTID